MKYLYISHIMSLESGVSYGNTLMSVSKINTFDISRSLKSLYNRDVVILGWVELTKEEYEDSCDSEKKAQEVRG